MDSHLESRIAGRRAPVRAVVDLDAIAANYRLLAARVTPRPLYAVVKADAYGHGAPAVARRLEAEGASRFAVAQTDEGVALRRAAVGGEILVLSHAEAEDLPRLRAYGLTPALYDVAQAVAFARAARGLSQPLPVHLELDTGMGRAGIRPEDLVAAVEALRGGTGLSVTGTFANLSSADDPASPATARQVALLREGASRLGAAGVGPGLVHAANSAGVFGFPASWLDAVRPGLALYGVPPVPEAGPAGLSPALSIQTSVLALRRVPAGTALGYGGRFVTCRDSTIAVLPIGYSDGYCRSFSGRTSVLVRGRRAPVVGAVSMDVTLADVTDSGAERGDAVTCLGTQGSETVTAWDLARAAATIPYEILCGFGPRVTRSYAGAVGSADPWP